MSIRAYGLWAASVLVVTAAVGATVARGARHPDGRDVPIAPPAAATAGFANAQAADAGVRGIASGPSDSDRAGAFRTSTADAPTAAGRARNALAAVIAATVERNPFRPERSPAPDRYHVRVPGEPESAAPAPPPRPAVPQMKLAGLVASGGGKGMAALEVSGASPRLLSVGDSIAGFRLTWVSATEAHLSRSDTTLVLVLGGPRP